jgi:hypothetical protein
MTIFKNVLLTSLSVTLFLGGITVFAQEVDAPTVVLPTAEEISKSPLFQEYLKLYSNSPEAVDQCRRTEACRQLLPQELLVDSKKIEPRVLTLKAGTSVLTSTGAGAMLGFQAMAPLGSTTVSHRGFQLPIPVYGVVRADGVIGSTASKGGSLPIGKVELGANAQYHFQDGDPVAHGVRKAEIEATVALDRSVPLERDWRTLGKVQAGVSFLGDPDDLKTKGYLSLAGFAQAGAAQSGDLLLPNFIDVGAKVDGVACPWHSKDGTKAFCFDGRIIGSAGLVQAGTEFGAGAHYLTELSKAEDATIKQLSFGPEFSGAANTDIAGPHSFAQGLLTVTVK